MDLNPYQPGKLQLRESPNAMCHPVYDRHEDCDNCQIFMAFNFLAEEFSEICDHPACEQRREDGQRSCRFHHADWMNSEHMFWTTYVVAEMVKDYESRR